MSNIRAELKKSQYKISKHAFYTAYHFALRYDEWKREYDNMVGLRAITADGMPGGTKIGDPTGSQAVRLAELGSNIAIIESCVRMADESLYKWILKGVTQENVTYNYLAQKMFIPCCRSDYYAYRRKFYWLLSQRIGAKE